MDTLYPTEILQIRQIIEHSKCEEEIFLLDSSQAAKDIMNYLQKKGWREPQIIDLETTHKGEFY